VKLAAFAVVLGVAFGGGAVAGAALGPDWSPPKHVVNPSDVDNMPATDMTTRAPAPAPPR
jgi:hypothetical protein